MENVFKKINEFKDKINMGISKRKKEKENKKIKKEKPSLKNLAKDFFKEVRKKTDIQKINEVYMNLTNNKFSPNLSISKKLNLILYYQKFGDKIIDTKKFLKNKKLKFNFPRNILSSMRRARKKKNKILVWYFNRMGIIEKPKIYPVYSGNMIIVRDIPHEVDPRAFWKMGKNNVLALKEIDRRAISNLDYAEIMARGDSTDSDEFLIKAALQSYINGSKKKKPINKKAIVVFVILALLALVYFMK
jgi:hypothetical protein